MANLYLKYPPGHSFGGIRVLNAGCGFTQYRHPNVVNVDAFDICAPDVVWDLNKVPLPFPDESFDLVLANHILEHLPNWWDTFNDFARVLKTGGILKVWVPAMGSDSVDGYRDHVVTINSCSFFGVFGTYREGGNAWSEENGRCTANRLKLCHTESRPAKVWWLQYAPRPVLKWCREHLRNTMEEDGYFFRKVTQVEFEQEQGRANERRDRALQVPRLPKAGVSGGY